ncbi:MAG: hypothetical protein ACOVQX_01660 [Legionella sp.]
MFGAEITNKNNMLEELSCAGLYQYSFFKPFDSLSDMTNNIKALAVMPIINFTAALEKLTQSIPLIILSVIYISNSYLFFNYYDYEFQETCIGEATENLVMAFYYTISIITDNLIIFTRFITHTLATINLGIHVMSEIVSQYLCPQMT